MRWRVSLPETAHAVLSRLPLKPHQIVAVLAIAILTVGTNMITDALAKESADTTGEGA